MSRRDIHEAIEKRDLPEVEAILDESPSEITVLSRLGDTPLHKAIWLDNVESVQLLINRGADVNAVGNQGHRPLHYAASQGYSDLARLLIKRGADVELRNDEGFTPLFVASRGREAGCPHVANVLVELGAHLDLHSAVCLGRVDDVRQIFQADPDAIETCVYGEDLVVDSVIARSLAILELLVSHGADVNDFKLAGAPAIFSTLGTRADPSIVQTLIKNGADVNAKNQSGRAVLAVAKRGGNQEIIDLLIDAGATE